MDKTVVKALCLLEVLAASNQPRGVTELAAEIGLTKANVHRLLRTLLSQGYVVQNDTDARYTLSLKLWGMGARALRRVDLLEVARAVVRQLCSDVGESVQLAVAEGGTVVYVDKADSAHPLRATTQIGSRVPMHCVSCGKAMLAFSHTLATKLQYPLSRHTVRTVVEPEQLSRELAQIRALGYAVNRGEWRDGIWGIAAPVYDAHGEVIASIDVWGPEERFRGLSAERLGRQVQRAAVRISAGLGHGPALRVAAAAATAATAVSSR